MGHMGLLGVASRRSAGQVSSSWAEVGQTALGIARPAALTWSLTCSGSKAAAQRVAAGPPRTCVKNGWAENRKGRCAPENRVQLDTGGQIG